MYVYEVKKLIKFTSKIKKHTHVCCCLFYLNVFEGIAWLLGGSANHLQKYFAKNPNKLVITVWKGKQPIPHLKYFGIFEDQRLGTTIFFN